MLQITGLVAGYGKLHILHGIDLMALQGQFAGIIGPNGSGKSTLIKSVFGLSTVFAGEIRFGGEPIQGLPAEEVSRRGIAYVPQTRNVFTPMTVRENLLLALRRRSKAEVDRAIDDAFALFPILQSRQRHRAGQLSGGERQMLAIAMAWLTEPRLMLLDEPSAGLAPLVVGEVFRKLRELCVRGVTLVVVEQNARSLLRACDLAYVMREGQIVLHGTPADIPSIHLGP
jgi:branched-chain amino acid transport system ATP-binding protein